MCKLLPGDKKTDTKVLRNKKRKNFNEHLILTFQNGLINLKPHTVANNVHSNQTEPNYTLDFLSPKREKSRIAAKKRRSQESDNLTELYLSLPVAAHSRLLSYDDSHFIGTFEKTTIIKVSAYVLKLYNSLSESHYFEKFVQQNKPIVSLFSQSMVGLFWCEDSSKVVFTTPGLARLTGLYWCNIVGMPLNSIIADSADRQHFSSPSDVMFLRFMTKSLIDRGIFTVQPPHKRHHEQTDYSEDRKGYASSLLVGKMPCSVWSSEQMSNGIRFDLIQPLVGKFKTSSDKIIRITSRNISLFSLPTNNANLNDVKCTGRPFSTYHTTDTFSTIALEDGILNALGFKREDFENSTLFSFFHLGDIVQVNNQLKELLADKTKIQSAMARICTSKAGVYRWCQYTLRISCNQDLYEPTISTHRTSGNQGEAYSQNVINALNELDQGCSMASEKYSGKSYIQTTFSLGCYYYKRGCNIIEFASARNKCVTYVLPEFKEKYSFMCNKLVTCYSTNDHLLSSGSIKKPHNVDSQKNNLRYRSGNMNDQCLGDLDRLQDFSQRQRHYPNSILFQELQKPPHCA